MIEAALLSSSDPRWLETLSSQVHDVYHLPNYVNFVAEYDKGEAKAFYYSDGITKVLIPLIVRALPKELKAPHNWHDATSPYGYPTPLLNSDKIDQLKIKSINEQFREICSKEDIVSVFLRLHPLIPLPEELLQEIGNEVLHGETVYLSLENGLDVIKAEIRKDHRYHIRKLKREGFKGELDNWDTFEAFLDIYNDTMNRVSASDYYQFPRSYFEKMKEALQSHLHLCSVISPQGQVAAAGLFTENCGIVQFHLSGTNSEYLNSSPAKLLLNFMIEWAVEKKFSLFHLGGGVGAAADSLFEFKRGFSQLTVPFSSLQVIVNDKGYRELVAKRHGDGNLAEIKYFPAYRG